MSRDYGHFGLSRPNSLRHLNAHADRLRELDGPLDRPRLPQPGGGDFAERLKILAPREEAGHYDAVLLYPGTHDGDVAGDLEGTSFDAAFDDPKATLEGKRAKCVVVCLADVGTGGHSLAVDQIVSGRAEGVAHENGDTVAPLYVVDGGGLPPPSLVGQHWRAVDGPDGKPIGAWSFPTFGDGL